MLGSTRHLCISVHVLAALQIGPSWRQRHAWRTDSSRPSGPFRDVGAPMEGGDRQHCTQHDREDVQEDKMRRRGTELAQTAKRRRCNTFSNTFGA